MSNEGKKPTSDDTATFSAEKGWGGKYSNLVKEVYDLDEWKAELADDEILKAQIAEDEKLNDDAVH